jgi:serine/threonine protein kinase
MGAFESKLAPSKTFSPEVEEIKNKLYTKYGGVRLVRERTTGQEMFLKKITFSDVEAFERNLVYYHERVNKPHINLINVIGYVSKEDRSYCSQYFTLKLFLDPLVKNLQTDFDQHLATRDLYSEIELQLCAQHLLTILAEFQRKDIYHGDICPENIWMTDEAFKLCDPTLNGAKDASFANSSSPLAPELLKQIATYDYEIKCDKYKADVFAMGITLLSLATLTKSEELYNSRKEGGMDLELLEARLQSAESLYSPTFTNMLRTFLCLDAESRPDFIQLHGKFNIEEHLEIWQIRGAGVSSYTRLPYIKLARALKERTMDVDIHAQTYTYEAEAQVPQEVEIVSEKPVEQKEASPKSYAQEDTKSETGSPSHAGSNLDSNQNGAQTCGQNTNESQLRESKYIQLSNSGLLNSQVN